MIKKMVSYLLTLSLIMSMCGVSLAANDTAQIKVMVNGKYVSFKDTAPVNRDGRILVSLSEVLEAMGADAVYDEKTNSVTAKLGGTSIDFTSTDSIINIERDGVKSQVKMDVAPIVINGEAIVPVRYLSESFGMNTSWDAAHDTVVIIDFDKMAKNIDAQYTILNKIMQLGYDKDKTYNQAGDYIINVTVNSPDDQSVSVDVTSKIDALIKGNDINMNFDMALKADLSKLPEEDALQVNAALEMFKDMKFQVIYNTSTTTLYFNAGAIGALFAAGLGEQVDADTWFKIDLSKYLDMSNMPVEFVKIASGDTSSITMGTLSKLILNSYNSYGIESYDQIELTLDILVQLFSDAAFKTSGTPESPRYDFAINSKSIKDALVSALTKRPAMIPGALEMIKNMDVDKFADFDLKSSVVINSQYDYTSTMDIKFNVDLGLISGVLFYDDSANGFVDFNLKSESSLPGETTMNFEFSMDTGEGGINMTETGDMKLNTVINDETVLTSPPEGVKIIDLSDM